MPTQRLEEKRVKESAGEGERERVSEGERERERKSTHTQERERKHFGSSFYMFFPPLGLPYANWT